jgi:uncharacterized protein
MSAGHIRRADRAMTASEVEAFLHRAAVAHFATVGAESEPYVVPNLFVYAEGMIYLHTATAGHFRSNVERASRICFDAAEMGEAFPYGGYACDTTTSYASIVGFGSIAIMSADDDKARFFDRFMAKYADPTWGQPASFYPRLADVTVYCISPERITGKHIALPPLGERWPARNRTRSPDAVAPPPASR